jgi:hypothetical protein
VAEPNQESHQGGKIKGNLGPYRNSKALTAEAQRTRRSRKKRPFFTTKGTKRGKRAISPAPIAATSSKTPERGSDYAVFKEPKRPGETRRPFHHEEHEDHEEGKTEDFPGPNRCNFIFFPANTGRIQERSHIKAPIKG